MDACIVEYDKGELARLSLANYRIKEVDHSLAVDITGMGGVIKALCTEVKRSQNGTLAVPCRFSLMGLAKGRPGTLHRGRGAEGGFVEVNQATVAALGDITYGRQAPLLHGKLRFRPLFWARTVCA